MTGAAERGWGGGAGRGEDERFFLGLDKREVITVSRV
jgi:hypothetical protein